jgi:hypothetical protein
MEPPAQPEPRPQHLAPPAATGAQAPAELAPSLRRDPAGGAWKAERAAQLPSPAAAAAREYRLLLASSAAMGKRARPEEEMAWRPTAGGPGEPAPRAQQVVQAQRQLAPRAQQVVQAQRQPAQRQPAQRGQRGQKVVQAQRQPAQRGQEPVQAQRERAEPARQRVPCLQAARALSGAWPGPEEWTSPHYLEQALVGAGGKAEVPSAGAERRGMVVVRSAGAPEPAAWPNWKVCRTPSWASPRQSLNLNPGGKEG